MEDLLSRSHFLFRIHNQSFLRRLKNDFVNELVVLICASILAATFYYMFNDFVNGQIARIRPDWQMHILKSAAALLLLLTSLWQGRKISDQIRSSRSLGTMAQRLGEKPSVVRSYHVISIVCFYVASQAVIVFATDRWLYSFSPRVWLTLSAAGLVIIAFRCLIAAKTTSRSIKPIQISGGTKKRTMVLWRLNLILRRMKGAYPLLALSVLCSVLASWQWSEAGKTPLVFISAYLSGFLAVTPVFLQLKQDLKMAWVERTTGVSHADILIIYRVIALILAAIFWLPFIATAIVTGSDVLEGTQIVFAGITPALLSSALLFQIDPRRPLIQFVTLFFAALFIATGIFVHLAAVIVIPGFNYYIFASQEGRYYRA
ncbi:hypothetical protein N9D31_01000 [Oligoflexaceae bacterium]|nr:hypothetical protein [Oligoflexaceae bacterium]